VVDRHPAKATELDVKARLRSAMISDDQRCHGERKSKAQGSAASQDSLIHHKFLLLLDRSKNIKNIRTNQKELTKEPRVEVWNIYLGNAVGRYWDFFTTQLGLELPRPELFASSSPTSIFESPTRNIYDLITIIMPSPLNHDPSHSKQSANLQESSMVVCGLVESSEFSLRQARKLCLT
jgi:hypothetical protein